MANLSVTALEAIGEIHAGDDLGVILHDAAVASGVAPVASDVFVVAQKIVSKSEGRRADLNAVTPSPRARQLAEQTGKDPRLVELVLAEAAEVVRAVPGVLIVRHRNGYVMANAGIDSSNVPVAGGREDVLLLPEDADRSAARLQERLTARCGCFLGVVIADSFGRPWRNGVVNVAIGAAGVPALLDRRGEHDRHGRRLEVTQVAVADLLASAAGLSMGEGAEGHPAVLIRGYPLTVAEARPAASLIRPKVEDLFQ